MSSNLTMATCLSQDWSFNSLGQSPCVVGSALAGVCVGGQFTLTPLQPDFVYLGPSVANANSCRCSSVYYSMLSACANCQGNNFVRWSAYNRNCSTVFLESFPQPLPSGIVVPNWAYLDVSKDDTFNITLARAAGGGETSLIPSATSRSSTRSSTSRTTTRTGTGTATSIVVEPKKVNAGAIAGGVIGGVVFVTLVGLLVFYLLRRRKQSKTPPSALYGPNSMSTSVPSTYSPPPMSHGDGSTFASIPAPKVYDPNDPTTWPTNTTNAGQYSPPPNAPNNQPYYPNPAGYIPPAFTGQSAGSGYTQGNVVPSGPRYTGAPEL